MSRDEHRPHLWRPWREETRAFACLEKGLEERSFALSWLNVEPSMGQPAASEPRLATSCSPCRTPPIAQTVAKVDERKAEWREARYLGG